MTRAEFIENIQDWWELIEFCDDEGCSICEDIYDDDAKDEYINGDLVDMARNADGWRDLLQKLNDIESGYDYYRLDGYGDFVGVDDDDFQDYKDDVIEWCDNNDIWDDEEDDEDEEYEEQADEEPAPPEVAVEDEDDDGFEVEEGCSIGDLFAASASCLQKIEIREQEAKEQEDSAFEMFIAG